MSKPKKSRLGKGLAIGLYAAAFIYLAGVGFASVIPQAFFGERDESFSERTCSDGFSELHEEVEALRRGFLMGERQDALELRTDLRSWDRKLRTLEATCGRNTTDPLLQYRHRTELTLQRHLREDGRMARQLEHNAPGLGAQH